MIQVHFLAFEFSYFVSFRYIANVLVGKLNPDETKPVFLIHSEYLDATNSQTIAKCFNNTLNILWPNEILHENVLLVVSDNAAYMTKAFNSLRVLYNLFSPFIAPCL